MNINDCLSVLGLASHEESITIDVVKKAYRVACSKYHPDRNPQGLEMMKMVNCAYSALMEHLANPENVSVSFTGKNTEDYGEEVSNALNAIFGLHGLIIEICGAWVWVTGSTKEHKDVLKSAGFFYASKKVAWYFRTKDFKSRSNGSSTLDQIRDKYGSQNATGNRPKAIH